MLNNQEKLLKELENDIKIEQDKKSELEKRHTLFIKKLDF